MKRKLLIVVLLLVLMTGAVLPAVADDAAPIAKNDSLDGLAGEMNSFPVATLFADNGSGEDDLGSPEAAIESFGGGSMGGSVTDHAAGTSGSLAGGTLIVNAGGALTLNNPTQTGLFTFIYRLRNSAGFNDASVTFEIREVPQANDDLYAFHYKVEQVKNAAGGLFADNGSGPDNLGSPVALLTSFGGGSLGGDVEANAPGSSVPLAGGTLTVNAIGSWSLSGAPFTPGDYTFNYRITNSVGESTAQVTLSIRAIPVAQDDALVAYINIVNTFLAPALFADNGNGEDDLGYPAATISSFGGGSLGGFVTDNPPGAPVAFAGGTLTVGSDGALEIANATTAGTYTVLYRLKNVAGRSDATVTIALTQKPVAKDDAYTFLNSADQTRGPATGLFANNGSGVDRLGSPLAKLVSFGGGALGGDVTSNAAGASVALAGGSLTVRKDGSWKLSGKPFNHGTYKFEYRLENSGGFSDATVTLTIQAAPVARDDSLLARLNDPFQGHLFVNNGSGEDDLGTPTAKLVSFGGGSLGGDISSNPAGTTVDLAGGKLTVNGNGSLELVSATVPGAYTFFYRLSNSQGTSGALVVILVANTPAAEDDAYTFDFGADKVAVPGAGLFVDNGSGADDLGTPAAILTTFGGESLGGAVTDHAAGTPAFLAGGVLTVNSNGSWTLSNAPFIPGEYKFSYRIANAGGISDAVVTLNVTANPTAKDDGLWAQLYVKSNYVPGKLFENNGHGKDEQGFPAADVVSFGGGDLGGSVGDNAAGTVVSFAGGKLTVNSDGSLQIDAPKDEGTFTFEYRLESSTGQSEATVTVKISEEPETFASLLPAVFR